MNTHFTQTAPVSSSKTRLQGATLVKAFFAAVVASLGFVGTANAQMNVTVGEAALIGNPTVTDYISSGGVMGTPTALSFASNTSMATVGATPSSQYEYVGASGGNHLVFPGGSDLLLYNIPVAGALTEVVVSMGIFVPTDYPTSANAGENLNIRYGINNGNGLGNSLTLINNASAPLVALASFSPSITKGVWQRISYTLDISDVNSTTGNIVLKIINPASSGSPILIDDIGVQNFNTGCTNQALEIIWKGSGTTSGTGDSNFNNAENWCPTGVPDITKTAVINISSPTTIQIPNGAAVAKLILINRVTTSGALNLQVASGGTFTIGAGGLTIAELNNGKINFNPASTASDPVIKLAGDLTDNSKAADQVLNLSNAKFAMNGGTAVQNIFSLSSLIFKGLTIDNNSNNDVDVVIANDITVNGPLVFTKGILSTGVNKVGYGTSATISETNTSFLKGNLDVLARNVGAGNESYGGLGVTLSIGAGTYATSINRITGTPITVEVPVIGQNSTTTNTSISRIFEVNVLDVPLLVTDLDATMKFDFWEHELNGLSASQLVFFRQNELGVWSNKGKDLNSLTNPTLTSAGSLTLSGIKAFSPWTLGSSITPLPVELISFSAKRDADASVLEWRTAKEENNAGYEIEASSDNRNFKTIGYVNAMQTAYQGAEYSFVEPKAASYGVRYYRLTQFDLDGTKTILGVRTVSFNTTGTSVITGPNPFTYGFAALVEADKAQPATLILTDALGREVARQQAQLVRGVNQVDFNGDQLSTGSYILSVQLETEVLTVKVNKQ